MKLPLYYNQASIYACHLSSVLDGTGYGRWLLVQAPVCILDEQAYVQGTSRFFLVFALLVDHGFLV